jgi:hypothetical protein
VSILTDLHQPTLINIGGYQPMNCEAMNYDAANIAVYWQTLKLQITSAHS